MAGIIKCRLSLEVNHDNSVWDPIGQRPFTVVQANVGGPTPGTIATSTTDTAVDLSELTTLGWVRLKNLDDTNNIDWGPDSGGSIVDMGTLEPGESAMFRFKPGVTLRVQADAGTPLLEVFAWED